MKCPFCGFIATGETRHRVLDTTPDTRGGIRRRRECPNCARRFTTYERPILSTPMLIKQGGDREEFDRDKLIRGVRVACAKRPVAAADIERMADRVESQLQQLGKPEIPSRLVGEIVIEELKELDPVAYIRYAIVFLGLKDLQSVHDEINRLLGEN
ncbi:MAG: transcriptional regulator NrdR [Anaerolineae bacterium]